MYRSNEQIESAIPARLALGRGQAFIRAGCERACRAIIGRPDQTPLSIFLGALFLRAVVELPRIQQQRTIRLVKLEDHEEAEVERSIVISPLSLSFQTCERVKHEFGGGERTSIEWRVDGHRKQGWDDLVLADMLSYTARDAADPDCTVFFASDDVSGADRPPVERAGSTYQSKLSAAARAQMRAAFAGLSGQDQDSGRLALEDRHSARPDSSATSPDQKFSVDRTEFFSVGRALQRAIGRSLLGSVTLRVADGKLQVCSTWGGTAMACIGEGQSAAELTAKSFCALITSRYRESDPRGPMTIVFRPALREVAIDSIGVKAKFPQQAAFGP